MMENLPFTRRDAFGARARIGLIALASDWTIEAEFHEILGPFAPQVALHQTRIANDPIITPASLAAMGPRLTDAAATILPGAPLDAIGYGCTSATAILGGDAVIRSIREAKPDAPVTTPLIAAIRAFRALSIRRPAVLTPYTRDVNESLLRALESEGVEAPILGSFNEPDDAVVARIDAASVGDAIRRMLAGRDADGVFVSCTSLRLIDAVEDLEAKTGLPVTSSNHALIWDCLRRAGVGETIPGRGRLYRL